MSFSEVSAALDCWARWDFSYGDQLAGDSLKPKRVAPKLSGGRAWGAAMAAYHSNVGDLTARQIAVDALDLSLQDDAARMVEFGVYLEEEHVALRNKLVSMVDHQIATAEPFACEPSVEHELNVPIPSRGGQRRSSKFRLLAYVDAYVREERGVWLVEFKLRDQLTEVELIQKSRQIRWYSWAWEQTFGVPVLGVRTIERLNEIPKPPRMVQAKKKVDGVYPQVPSHAKDQITTPDLYRSVCQEHGVEPDEETLIALGARRWGQDVPIMFSPGELAESGHELVSAAKLISALDSGSFYPLRNAKPQTCRGCRFREICNDPDNGLVDALFERRPAKRNRDPEEAAA